MSTERAPAPAVSGAARQRVWDLPLRLCHWSLVLSVGGSIASHYAGASAFGWHVGFGYLTLGLVLFRLAWSAAGTRYARFAEFVRTPRAAAGAPGHTAAGGWMALALLLALGAQASLGLCANDDLLNGGPLSGLVGRALSDRLSELHARLATVLEIAIGAHVAAALYFRIVRHDDRITPLLTGFKRGLAPGSDIGAQRMGRALLIAAAVAAALVWLALAAPPPLAIDD